jgi:hypothetical protein
MLLLVDDIVLDANLAPPLHLVALKFAMTKTTLIPERIAGTGLALLRRHIRYLQILGVQLRAVLVFLDSGNDQLCDMLTAYPSMLVLYDSLYVLRTFQDSCLVFLLDWCTILLLYVPFEKGLDILDGGVLIDSHSFDLGQVLDLCWRHT